MVDLGTSHWFIELVLGSSLWRAGHEQTAERRSSGEQPYQPTAAKSGGFIVPANRELPNHLVTHRTCRVAQLFKLQNPGTTSLKLPAGCVNMALIQIRDADLLIVEDLADLDLDVKMRSNAQWAAWLQLLGMGFTASQFLEASI